MPRSGTACSAAVRGRWGTSKNCMHARRSRHRAFRLDADEIRTALPRGRERSKLCVVAVDELRDELRRDWREEYPVALAPSGCESPPLDP